MSQDIDVAVKWWIDKLREQPLPDNGDPYTTGVMQGMALIQRMTWPAPTEDQLATFSKALTEAMEAWRESHDYWPSVDLGVDYDPDPMLADALEAAGLRGGKVSGLPMKTMMFVKPDKVTVKEGYGADWVTLWAVDEEG